MKKQFLLLTLSIVLFTGIISCDDEGANIPSEVEVQNFIWKGLNAYYFWQQDLPDLSDQRFTSQEQLNSFLDGKEPEPLFYSLLNNYPETDKYSWIVDDYIALEEQLLQGITGTTGIEFGLAFQKESTTAIYGYVKYIVNDSDASTKNIKRGDIFSAVNDIPLTVDNYSSLLFDADSYTLNFADYNDRTPILNGTSVSFTKSKVQENPILTTKTFDVAGKKIGYLMYNSFTPTFDNELNNAFGTLKSEGITDLVLDLRYNSGGSVKTASYLASMITGQFNGDIFTKERWNDKWQNYFTNFAPESLVTNFSNKLNDGTAINSLNLDKVTILITNSSASASELIINSLNPYINVTTIGSKTEGKYVASVTLYDSFNFGRTGANPNHTWAMQPIVLEELNKINENDKDGFDPTFEFLENRGNLGILGEVTEPLLERAIQFITTGSKNIDNSKIKTQRKDFSSSKKHSLLGSRMFVDKELIRLN